MVIAILLSSFLCEISSLLKINETEGVGEVAQWFGALDVLIED